MCVYVYKKVRSQLEGLQQNKKSYRYIISYSSSARRSVFSASRWSKLSSVTGCFTACISAHSPAIELDNTIRFRLRSGLL